MPRGPSIGEISLRARAAAEKCALVTMGGEIQSAMTKARPVRCMAFEHPSGLYPWGAPCMVLNLDYAGLFDNTLYLNIIYSF